MYTASCHGSAPPPKAGRAAGAAPLTSQGGRLAQRGVLKEANRATLAEHESELMRLCNAETIFGTQLIDTNQDLSRANPRSHGCVYGFAEATGFETKSISF